MRWCTNKEQHAYMKQRQDENLSRCVSNRNENWMACKLELTGLKWKRQAQWGYRLFDFWNSRLGVAVEVDGLEHDKDYDSARDRHNFKRSGIIVLRVRNRNESDAENALRQIANSESWNIRREAIGLKPIGVTHLVEAC